MRHPFAATTSGLLLCLVATGVGFAESVESQQSSSAEGQWISLFNGRDLEGWTPKIKGYHVGENFGDTFRVDDGVLKVSYDAYEKFDNRFGHLFYRQPYSHYRLRVEYRIVGDQLAGGAGWALRNSGIMIHGESPKTMAKNQDFPVSIEVQLLGGDGDHPRSTGNLCTPGTHVVMDDKLVRQHCTNSTSKTFHGDQWVTAEVEVHGSGQIKHFINGQCVLTYSKPQLDDQDAHARSLIKDGNPLLTGGTISLQSESHPIEFRKVELMVLPGGDE